MPTSAAAPVLVSVTLVLGAGSAPAAGSEPEIHSVAGDGTGRRAA
jgi:hypothetical protein